jgi:hypothetical protein
MRLLYFVCLLVGLLSLLLCWSTLLLSPASYVAQADSLKGVLREGKPDTSKVNMLLRLSNTTGARPGTAHGTVTQALVMARQAHTLSQELAYSLWKGGSPISGR